MHKSLILIFRIFTLYVIYYNKRKNMLDILTHIVYNAKLRLNANPLLIII